MNSRVGKWGLTVQEGANRILLELKNRQTSRHSLQTKRGKINFALELLGLAQILPTKREHTHKHI